LQGYFNNGKSVPASNYISSKDSFINIDGGVSEFTSETIRFQASVTYSVSKAYSPNPPNLASTAIINDRKCLFTLSFGNSL